ncbi:YadA-like family protein [Pasteurella sp. P03HT]
MNKIYRTLWNKATQSSVVVSELTKSGGKKSSAKTGLVNAAGNITLTASLLFTTTSVIATTESGDNFEQAKHKTCYYNPTTQNVICGDKDTTAATKFDSKPSKSVAIGRKVKTSGESNVAIGADSATTHTASIAIGAGAKATNDETVAIGKGAKAEGQWDISIGRNTGSTGSKNSNIAVGDGALKDAQGTNNIIAIGTGASSQSGGSHNVAIGTEANKNITTHYATAVGYKTAASGQSSVAIGNGAKSIGATSVALGFTSAANADFAIAVGREAKAGASSVALGAKTDASQPATIALGVGAKAKDQRAIAIGENADASGQFAIAIGTKDIKATGAASVSIGRGTKTRSHHSIAIGLDAETGVEGSGVKDAESAIALGQKAKAKQQHSIAFGHEAMANHKDAVALGANSVTADVIKTNDATVQGFTYSGFAGNAPLSTVSIGSDTIKRTLTNVAAGRISENSTDAVNGSQLYLALNTFGYVGDTLVKNVLGGNANIEKAGNTAGSLTMSNIGGTGQNTLHDAIAAVNTAAAQKTEVIAGKNITVKNTGSTTHPRYTVETTEDVEFKTVKVGENQEIEMDKDGITAGNVYINTQEDDITGLSNTTLGQDNFAADGRAATEEQLSETVDNVVKVLGGNAQNENGEISMSNIGDTGENTIHDAIKAINATAKAAKTTVEAGENIEVTTKAADDGSQTYTVATKKDVKFNSVVTSGTKIDHNGVTFVNDEGTAISNSPIISKTGIDAGQQKVKQVQNGEVTKASKDAVNGSQLFAQGEGVKNMIGGNTTYDATTGKYTNQDIGGTGKNTIHDAIKASQTEVTAGKNMKVASSKGANGQTVYQVATQDKVAFTEVKVGPNVTMNESGLQVGNIHLNTVTNKITGIAKGEVSATSTEAINGSQLYHTHQHINKLDKNLRAGIAGANAAAGLPQAYLPGKSMVAIAAGTYKGENALALGVSRISDNGKVIIKLTGNTDSRGDVGGSVGAGYQW